MIELKLDIDTAKKLQLYLLDSYSRDGYQVFNPVAMEALCGNKRSSEILKVRNELIDILRDKIYPLKPTDLNSDGK